jgi:hypothetical protein
LSWLWPASSAVTEVGCLGRFGRVAHWLGASIAALCALGSAIAAGLRVLPPHGVSSTDLMAILVAFSVVAVASYTVGRALRYVLAAE